VSAGDALLVALVSIAAVVVLLGFFHDPDDWLMP
jgi:hypothetical protein